MEFTKEQLSELICKHTEKENGLQDLMEIMLESLMVCRAQGISARGGSFREQVQRVPSGQDLRSRADIDIPDTA